MTWVISNSGTVLVNMRRVMEVIMSFGVPHTQLWKTWKLIFNCSD